MSSPSLAIRLKSGQTRSRVQDIFLNLSLSLDKAPPGSYNVKFIVNDLNSKKTAAVDTDVTIK